MAITKIHPIEVTLNYAVEYIVEPHKTEEQKYVDGFRCNPLFATNEFDKTKDDMQYSGKVLGYHLIQSFFPGETTPEMAHEIGKKLCDELLKGQYEYVISTHVDKEHIHNHIIINSVNAETGKSFSTELDRKSNPAWKQIRAISDRLCKENELSVIKNAERGKGKSHYEWEQDKDGKSWKSRLKIAIDNCIKTADSFDDFLAKMRELGYEIKQGKHIAFRAAGQEKFTRAKSLGFYYQEEQLRNRIERRIMWRQLAKEREAERIQSGGYSSRISLKKNERFVKIEGQIEQNEGLKRWAMLQNMKNASKLLNELAEKGVDNAEQLKARRLDLYDTRLDITDEIKKTEFEIHKADETIRLLSEYRKLKPVNEQYKAAKNKDKFFREHESELHSYQSVKKNVQSLLNENGKLPALGSVQKHKQELVERKASLMREYDSIKAEISELEKMQKRIESLEQSQAHKSRTGDNLT
ncbi:MAG: relaxase/mobilization nuclease domain-containing protein [Ruminiclostridium sp.]